MSYQALPTRKIVYLFVVAVAVCGIFYFATRYDEAQRQASEFNRKQQEDAILNSPLHEYEYTNVDGQKIKLSQMLGKVWVADFVFTRCMGPCPLLTAKMRRLQKHYEGDDRIRFVSISVDPKNDTPEVLGKFAAKYEPDLKQWYFLTGPKDQTIALARNLLHVPADQNPDLHTTRFIVVGARGEIRDSVDTNEEQFFQTVKSVIDATLNRVAAK